MKQPFYQKEQKVFIKGINKAGIVKETDSEQGKYKITFYNREDKRITSWFDVSQIEECKPKKKKAEANGGVIGPKVVTVFNGEAILSREQVDSILKSNEDVTKVTSDIGKRISETLKKLDQDIRDKDNTLYFAKVKPTAIIPSKRDEDGCYDVYADQSIEEITISPGQIVEVPTGIASAFSSKYRLDFQRERGSTGSIGLTPRCGQIDSGFRGEIFLKLQNVSQHNIIITSRVSEVEREINFKELKPNTIYYPITKAVCQAALEIVPDVEVKEIPYKELEKIPSQRGKGKLGSSNK
ncbi:deoxyuridine 5'-triphosphate nucleotidohydrolase [compost metagenome]